MLNEQSTLEQYWWRGAAQIERANWSSRAVLVYLVVLVSRELSQFWLVAEIFTLRRDRLEGGKTWRKTRREEEGVYNYVNVVLTVAEVYIVLRFAFFSHIQAVFISIPTIFDIHILVLIYISIFKWKWIGKRFWHCSWRHYAKNLQN